MVEGTIKIKEEFFRFHQRGVSSLVVDAMAEGLKLGHEMPEISLHQCGAGFDDFETDFYGIFDGNHRFMAHKKMGMNPKWSYPPGWAEVPYYEFTKEEVLFDDGFSAYETEGRLKDSLRHLPRDIAERFCFEKKLDSGIYLPQ